MDGYDDMGDGYKGDKVLKWVGWFFGALIILLVCMYFINAVFNA